MESWTCERERIRVAFSLDCCDREVMIYVATAGGISGVLIRNLMAESIEARFGVVAKIPRRIQWLSDNDPAYIARETRFFAKMMGLEVCTTPYRSPESNGMAESFIKTFNLQARLLQLHPLHGAREVMEVILSWFRDYNENHPHKGLKMMSPKEFREHQFKLEVCPGK